MTFKEYITSFFSGLRSLLVGMGTTIKVFFRRKTTEQYPENRATLKISDRFRGELVMIHNDKNEHRCVACGICQMNCPLIIGIENDNICVRTYRQRSLSRIDTVDFCRLSGNNIYKFLAGQLSRAYTFGPHHMQSIAGAGGTVWNLSKIIPAGLLELCHIYTAVVG